LWNGQSALKRCAHLLQRDVALDRLHNVAVQAYGFDDIFIGCVDHKVGHHGITIGRPSRNRNGVAPAPVTASKETRIGV
jgi:hypothetical protein